MRTPDARRTVIERWLAAHALNVFSPMYVMKYAVPYMLKQQSGSIVVIVNTHTTGMPMHLDSIVTGF